MKKLMMLIMILGSVTLAEDWTGLSFNNIAAADNILQATPSDIVLEIQPDNGSVCVVYLEITDVGRASPAAAWVQADIINQLPDVATLVLLGFAGLFYRRRKE